MPASINGWAVLNWGDPRLKEIVVPGTKIKLSMRNVTAPLFAALAADYAQTVAPLRPKEVWSHDYRPARASAAWSDHSSGTAVDLNSAHEGAQGPHGGMATMTSAQIAACVALKKKYRIVIWGGDKARGGDYGNPKYWDPMHFALKPGTSIADVEAVIKALGIRPDGTVAPVFKPVTVPVVKPVVPPAKPVVKVVPAYTGPLHLGSHGPQVKSIQVGLGITTDGVFGPVTLAAVKKYQRWHPSLWPADGVVGPKTYKALARPI